MPNTINPSTPEWREQFSAQMMKEFEHSHEILKEVREVVKAQNNRVRSNELAIASAIQSGLVRDKIVTENRALVGDLVKQVNVNSLAIASLKTWVALVGGITGIGSVVALAISLMGGFK